MTIINTILSLYATTSSFEAFVIWSTLASVPIGLLTCAISIFGKKDSFFTLYMEVTSVAAGLCYRNIWMWVVALIWTCVAVIAGWPLAAAVLAATMIINVAIYFPTMKIIALRAARQHQVRVHLDRLLSGRV